MLITYRIPNYIAYKIFISGSNYNWQRLVVLKMAIIIHFIFNLYHFRYEAE